MLPDILLKKRQGGLGRQKPTDDGISALVTTGPNVGGTLAQNTVYELRSLVAAEALGITAASAAYTAVHYQLSEFFRLSPGAVLLLLVSDATSMATLADRTQPYGKKLLQGANGRVKQIGFYMNPNAAPGGVDFIDDVVPAISKAQALADEEFTQHRPTLCLIGGSGLPADLSTLPDLTTKLAPSVAVVVVSDMQQPTLPAIGALLGMVSAVQVHICIGWVGGCQLASDGRFLAAGLSNGVAITDLLPGDLEGLNDKGYITALQHAGADGFYFSDSPTCVGKDSDFCQIENVRTINKMARLVRQALLPQLKGPLLLTNEGTLQAQVLGELEEKGANALTVNMGRLGELSALDVYIDPEQVLSSSTGGTPLKVDFSGVPVGVSRVIEASIGLVTSI